MKKKEQFGTSTLVVLFLAFSIIVISLIAVIIGGRDKSDAPLTTELPALTFPHVSEVPLREDVTVTHSERTLEDCYEKDGVEYIYSFISFPFIEGGDPDATSKINSAILSFATERVAIKEFEKTNAEDAYKRDDAEEFVQFEFITSTESLYVKNGYLSIAFRRVRTMSLNDPQETLTTVCFDLLTGNVVSLPEFMNVDENTAASFISDVFTQHIKINPNVYYKDALETLPDILDTKSFYLTENGVILYFNPNIITPSVNGVQEFTVPYDKIGY